MSPAECPPDAEDFGWRALGEVTGLLIARGASRSQAEDVASEALVRAFERWDEVSSMRNPMGWVVRVALNHSRSLWKRWSRENLDGWSRERLDDEFDHSGAVALAIDARSAVRALPPQQRDTILVRYYLGFDVASSATALNCAEGTVKSNTHRALKTLRSSRHFADSDFDLEEEQ